MSVSQELTIKNKEALTELKKRIADDVPDHLRDDIYLYLRFLRARDFNVDLAEDMLKNHLVWRKANQIDSILQNFVPPDVIIPENDSKFFNLRPSEKRNSRMGVVLKYLPLTRICFDKEGAPVRYFDFGNMDAKGMLKCVKKSDCVKSVIRCFEEDVVAMKEQTAKLNKPIEQWTYVLNFENYSFAKATHKTTLEALVALFMAYEANYPERLKAAYVVNTSVYFGIVFSVIKPLLTGNTLKKIQIFGKDGWKEELLKHIHEEDLPAFLGGKKTDSDGNPLCESFVKHGSPVPEKYFVTKSTKRLSTLPDVQRLTVGRLSKATLNLDVAEPGSLIEWEFETETGKDIGFGLLYHRDPTQDDAKELMPSHRVDTQMVSETGVYQCELPGTYILVFDNTYSWIHQKEIYYKATVVTPKN